MSIRSKLHDVVRRSAVLRRTRLEAIAVERRLRLQWAKHLELDRKLVIFEAYGGRSYACSPKALYKQMQADPRYADHTFVWALRRPEKHRWLVDRDPTGRTHVVRWRSRAYYRYFARAYLWIVNAELRLEVPKRRNQVMVQTWHGSPLKKLRLDMPQTSGTANASYTDIVRRNELDVSRWDILLSPSEFASAAFTTAFDLKRLGKQDILIECGYPRNQSLFDVTESRRDWTLKYLGIPQGKKVLLYAPTWRENEFDPELGYVHNPHLDFEAVRETLGDEWVVVYRGHYQATSQVDFSQWDGFVVDASHIRNVNKLYAVADALVTDYSSTFFDYALLDRPILFFMYDVTTYERDLRGFYLSLDELPGEIARTQEELLAILGDMAGYTQRTARLRVPFLSRFAPQENPESPNAALNIITEATDAAA